QFYGNPTLATFMGGGTGSDTFYNYNGNDTIMGGSGSNSLIFQGDGTISLTQETSNLQTVDVALVATIGNISNGSNTISGLQNTAQLVVGETVFGSGIPNGTVIVTISATSITISNNATTTSSISKLTFGWVIANGAHHILGINVLGVQLGSGN